MSIALAKVEATGNDFLLFDMKANTAMSRQDLKRLAPIACDRHFGLGADGLIGLEELAVGVWKWTFFNSDGSSAEMCGNASRGVGRYLTTTYELDRLTLETEVGSVEISKDGKLIRSLVGKLKKAPKAHTKKNVWLVNSGVPHAVVLCEGLEIIHKSEKLISTLRRHGEAGHNVTFVTRLGKTVTFERGVEDFTLSCGTGMIASAAVLRLHKPKEKRFTLITAGGKAFVEFEDDGRIALVGPAHFISKMEFFVPGDQ